MHDVTVNPPQLIDAATGESLDSAAVSMTVQALKGGTLSAEAQVPNLAGDPPVLRGVEAGTYQFRVKLAVTGSAATALQNADGLNSVGLYAQPYVQPGDTAIAEGMGPPGGRSLGILVVPVSSRYEWRIDPPLDPLYDTHSVFFYDAQGNNYGNGDLLPPGEYQGSFFSDGRSSRSWTGTLTLERNPIKIRE